jgi:aminoglycoside 6'-N-acetyltransferase I
MIKYEKATINDIRPITELALFLYPGDSSFECLYDEYKESLQSDRLAVFLAMDGEKIIGFGECSLRTDYVEGTNGGTVGYLEGIYVLPEYRLCGIAKSLVKHCENWAKDNGCVEFASDCLLDNIDSYDFHTRIGFQEANRLICFTKNL